MAFLRHGRRRVNSRMSDIVGLLVSLHIGATEGRFPPSTEGLTTAGQLTIQSSSGNAEGANGTLMMTSTEANGVKTYQGIS